MSAPITPEAPFKLTDGDCVSPTWARLSKHLSARLDYLRVQLEADHDERKTARIRGQIAEVKRLLDTAKNT